MVTNRAAVCTPTPQNCKIPARVAPNWTMPWSLSQSTRLFFLEEKRGDQYSKGLVCP